MRNHPERTRVATCIAVAGTALGAACIIGATSARVAMASTVPMSLDVRVLADWWSNRPAIDSLSQLGGIGAALGLAYVAIILLDTSRRAALMVAPRTSREEWRAHSERSAGGLRASRALVAFLAAATGAMSAATPAVGAATDSGSSATTAADSATAPTADLVVEADGPSADVTAPDAVTAPGAAANAPAAGPASGPGPDGPTFDASASPTPDVPPTPSTRPFRTEIAPPADTERAPAPATPPRPDPVAAASDGDLTDGDLTDETAQPGGRSADGAPAPAGPSTERVVAEGDSFWSIAADEVGRSLGRAPLDREVADYWNGLIEANRDRLPDPSDPDLIVPGMRLTVPPVTMPVVMPGR